MHDTILICECRDLDCLAPSIHGVAPKAITTKGVLDVG